MTEAEFHEMVKEATINFSRFILLPLVIGSVLFFTLLDARSSRVVNAEQIEDDVAVMNTMLAAHILRMDEFCVNFDANQLEVEADSVKVTTEAVEVE